MNKKQTLLFPTIGSFLLILAFAACDVDVGEVVLPPPTVAKSNITLPNRVLTNEERNLWIADYRSFGGPTTTELEVIRLINIERAKLGLSQVARDDKLMMAARFFAQQAYDLRGLGYTLN